MRATHALLPVLLFGGCLPFLGGERGRASTTVRGEPDAVIPAVVRAFDLYDLHVREQSATRVASVVRLNGFWQGVPIEDRIECGRNGDYPLAAHSVDLEVTAHVSRQMATPQPVDPAPTRSRVVLTSGGHLVPGNGVPCQLRPDFAEEILNTLAGLTGRGAVAAQTEYRR